MITQKALSNTPRYLNALQRMFPLIFEGNARRRYDKNNNYTFTRVYACFIHVQVHGVWYIFNTTVHYDKSQPPISRPRVVTVNQTLFHVARIQTMSCQYWVVVSATLLHNEHWRVHHVMCCS